LGYLNAKMLQKVFEVFNEKVSEADVESKWFLGRENVYFNNRFDEVYWVQWK